MSNEDAKAVVRIVGEGLRLVSNGDPIGESGEITAISENRLVIDLATPRGPETVILSLDGDTQRVERIGPLLTRPRVYSTPGSSLARTELEAKAAGTRGAPR